MTWPVTLLLIVRPEPGGSATLAAARRLGLPAISVPLFAVRPVAWTAPLPDRIDALLIGSANVLRCGGRDLALYRAKPAYAVGAVTAQAAQAAGLAVVATGSGGMQPLLAALDPTHRCLLRLAGRARVALSPPPGVTVVHRIVYDSAAVPMPEDLAGRLANAPAGSVVLLHSAAAARHFAAECDRLQLPRARLALAALGPRIAAAAGGGWRAVASAAAADDAALLALARLMCQESAMPQPER